MGGGCHPPLSFFGNYSETVQFSILKFSDFSQIIVSDIFGLIHFFVSFSVWAVEGHFFAYMSEIWPKNGDFQIFWKIFKPFSAEINTLTSNLWNYNKNWKKKNFFNFFIVSQIWSQHVNFSWKRLENFSKILKITIFWSNFWYVRKKVTLYSPNRKRYKKMY